LANLCWRKPARRASSCAVASVRIPTVNGFEGLEAGAPRDTWKAPLRRELPNMDRLQERVDKLEEYVRANVRAKAPGKTP
jgi:hypothetical protein